MREKVLKTPKIYEYDVLVPVNANKMTENVDNPGEDPLDQNSVQGVPSQSVKKI